MEGTREVKTEISDHRHAINVAILESQAQLNLKCEQDGYFYVLDGCVEIRRASQAVTASADDLIVAEPISCLRIQALRAPTRLYWASDIVCASPHRLRGTRKEPGHGLRRAAVRRTDERWTSFVFSRSPDP